MPRVFSDHKINVIFFRFIYQAFDRESIRVCNGPQRQAIRFPSSMTARSGEQLIIEGQFQFGMDIYIRNAHHISLLV